MAPDHLDERQAERRITDYRLLINAGLDPAEAEIIADLTAQDRAAAAAVERELAA
jgi:hypothetical protein